MVNELEHNWHSPPHRKARASRFDRWEWPQNRRPVEKVCGDLFAVSGPSPPYYLISYDRI